MILEKLTSCIIMFIVCILIILIHFLIGFKNVKYLESVCTKTILAKIISIRKYRFFTKNYYSVEIVFNYDNMEYKIKKGLFRNLKENETEINIHINPNNPKECYLVPIRERCGFH